MNLSINETMSRTVMTSGTTLLALWLAPGRAARQAGTPVGTPVASAAGEPAALASGAGAD